jgi:hypothetical protein
MIWAVVPLPSASLATWATVFWVVGLPVFLLYPSRSEPPGVPTFYKKLRLRKTA